VNAVCEKIVKIIDPSLGYMGKGNKEKGKKSGSQRKKKSEGPDIPWKEALLAYE